MSYINFWYCIGAAVVVIAGTYIFFGPSNRLKRKKNGYVPGLFNFGNSCFLNAVLQAVAACPSCISWLQNVVSSANESTLSSNYVLIKSLLSVLNALNVSGDACSGSEVIEALRAHRWTISNEEQDAHELFHVLTTTIEEELMSVNRVLSLLDTNKLEGGTSSDENVPKKSFISLSKTSLVKVGSPLRGLLVSELKCSSCNSKYPARYDNFDSISLVIPSPSWPQLTLQDLLMKFISCELVQDVACDICSKQSKTSPENNCNIRTIFSKQLSFGKLPKCLCIHIQRTMWLQNGLPVKCFDYVSFPEILIMDYFVHHHMKKNKQLRVNFAHLGLAGGNSLRKNLEESAKSKAFAMNKASLKELKELSDEISTNMNRIGPSTSKDEGEESAKSKAFVMNSAALKELNEPSEEVSTNMNKSGSSRLKDEGSSSFRYVYLLKAVIVHLGDTSSGHFITYRRGAINSKNEYDWYCVSDLEVKEVSFSEVSQSCAYMLFYERLGNAKYKEDNL